MKRKGLCAGFLLVLAVIFGGPAHADSSDECGGKLVELKKAKAPNGKIVGYLQLYYNAQNGLNCAVFKHSDATWNKELYTYVNLYECLNKACTSTRVQTEYKADDGGFYKFGAGPVRQPGENRCIQAYGYINTNKQHRGLSQSTVGVESAQHCG